MAHPINHQILLSELRSAIHTPKFSPELETSYREAARRANETFELYRDGYYGNFNIMVSNKDGFNFEFEHLKLEIKDNGDIEFYLRNYCWRGLRLPQQKTTFYEGGDVRIRIPKAKFGSAKMITTQCIKIEVRGGWRVQINWTI